jgi:hypothetical protein
MKNSALKTVGQFIFVENTRKKGGSRLILSVHLIIILVVNFVVLHFFYKKYITFHQNVIITFPYPQVKTQ